jgi:hypothetical protein
VPRVCAQMLRRSRRGKSQFSQPRATISTNESEARGLKTHRFQIALRSRCTAMQAGLRTLIQKGPDRYAPSTSFEADSFCAKLARGANRSIFSNVFVKQDARLNATQLGPSTEPCGQGMGTCAASSAP